MAQAAGQGPAATVLVVDDDRTNILVLVSQLKSEGYRTMTAGNGQEALDAVARELPDLILLDVMMPGMDGFETASRLKADPRSRNVPIIMVTAVEDRESRLAALAAGAEEFVAKPVERIELLIRVRNLLKLKKYQDMLSSRGEQLEQQVAQRASQLAVATLRLNEVQERALGAEKLASIGQLAAGVAHEINNPISFVNSNLVALGRYVEQLLAGLTLYEEAERFLPANAPVADRLRQFRAGTDLSFIREDMLLLLKESQEGITRVRKIVQDLRDFSHIDQSQSWQWASIHQCLDSTLNVAGNEIRQSADVLKDYGTLPDIECLPLRLNQVFLNILLNAAQAIDRQRRGRITIRTGCSDTEVWVDISDTGCGMSADDVKRIFDPFFTTKPVGAGTGLGLSVAYGIIEEHRGRIEVSSEPGTGSTFRVTLPIRHTT
jgi:signal transduction histidine kinase